MLYCDGESKARILSKQFQSVFNRGQDNAVVMSGPGFPTMKELYISKEGVCEKLERIKVHKAFGPDELPNRELRELSNELAGPLTAIFRQYLETSQLPDDWRNAYITPIFKKGNHHESSNYRPVSLTSVCCKLLEHIVCSHIREHLDVNNVLSRFQHGFRKGHSCESQLLLTVNDLASYHDCKVQVDIAVLDFSKAFDVVPHKSLMRKLTHYGIGGNVHNWIGSFLMERQQQVIVDGEQSMKVHVDSGVPQGTVMGPLLFLLYINDLPGHVTSTVRLFADDCLLYRPIRTPDDQVKLQQDLHALTTWATTWGMKFNPSKCHILTTCKNVRLPVQIYSLCECALSHVPDTRYLRITRQEDLHWHKHQGSPQELR